LLKQKYGTMSNYLALSITELLNEVWFFIDEKYGYFDKQLFETKG